MTFDSRPPKKSDKTISPSTKQKPFRPPSSKPVPNLEFIACRLVEAKVDFVLCGGLAAFLQGSSILTRDVDVVCDMGSDNIGCLFKPSCSCS